MVFAEYTIWTEAIWDILERQAELRCARDGIADFRQDAQILIPPHGPDRQTTAGSIRADIRKALKLLDSAAPHTVLPHVLSAVHSARQIGAWRIHRMAVVVMAETLLRLDRGLEAKVVDLMRDIWDGLTGDDADVRALGTLVLGKAEVDVAMQGEAVDQAVMGECDLDRADADSAILHLRQALAYANQARYRQVATQASSILAMLAELGGAEYEPEEWPLDPKFSSRIQQIAEVVKAVGAKVARPKTSHA
jgi:hypothetical protein